MRRLNKIVFFTIIFTLIALIIMPMNFLLAADIDNGNFNPDNLTTNSPSVLLMDASSGNLLYAKNIFEKKYPASTTKLMTAILALENCKLDDVATVSRNAIFSIPVGYSHASLKEGEELTIEQLLNVLLIPSANDAAIVLAEHIAGSVEKFADMMNAKAKELGCLNTHFVNPNGVHDDNHYSTAYDMALIGRYAMKFDDITRISMVTQYTLPKTNKYDKEDRVFNTTNGLVTKNDEYYYPEAIGLKTGYTDKSGYCIVTTAKKGDVELLEVVMGSDTIDDRYSDCIKLFDYGFENYSYQNLVSSSELIDTIEVDGATKETKSLDIVAKSDIDILLKNNIDVNGIEPSIEINDNISAPVSEGAVVGKISFEIDGKTYSTDLIANEDVEATNFETIVFRVLLIFLILYLLVIILKRINKPHDRNSNMKSTRHSKTKKAKRIKSKKGGRYKFTQISEYL